LKTGLGMERNFISLLAKAELLYRFYFKLLLQSYLQNIPLVNIVPHRPAWKSYYNKEYWPLGGIYELFDGQKDLYGDHMSFHCFSSIWLC